jgi:DNA topoisomerase-2
MTERQHEVSKLYTKLEGIEHVLLRPDTYIGTTDLVTDEEHWVMDCCEVGDGNFMLNKRPVTYSPGLFKIFDEILVNAADHFQRDVTMRRIDVDIDTDKNSISVRNDGFGIPIVKHPEFDQYIPEMIFGELMSGSNFNDDEDRVTGGRNGLGAKLCNIYSTVFIVETVNSRDGLCYVQRFSNNMRDRDIPSLERIRQNAKQNTDYTKITFYPDLEKFQMTSLNENDMVPLIRRRIYDIAGCNSELKVYLNGNLLKMNNFKDYAKLYLKSLHSLNMVNEEWKWDNKNLAFEQIWEDVEEPIESSSSGGNSSGSERGRMKRWEVVLAPNLTGSHSFFHWSFVNSISTCRGGTHVKYVMDNIIKYIRPIIKKKNGGIDVKPNSIRQHFCIFINCLIVNPTFDSQLKETLTSKPHSYGTVCKLSPQFLKRTERMDALSNILAYHRIAEEQKLFSQSKISKSGSRKRQIRGIDKLTDANWAGTKRSLDCILILTEGDSAKTLAVSGLSIVGHNQYGVFPLRGKVINAKTSSNTKVMNNKELKAVVEIMGLEYGKIYDPADSSSLTNLRYGHLMIMADQDVDGSHIKGLIINLIHTYWPSLLRWDGFLQEFITPIIKVKAPSKKISNHFLVQNVFQDSDSLSEDWEKQLLTQAEISFFTVPEFNRWRTHLLAYGDTGRKYFDKWCIKYYKGLGTSDTEEVRSYFNDLKNHIKIFTYDEVTTDEELCLVFGNKTNDRTWKKDWIDQIMKAEEDTYLDSDGDSISIHDFIHQELVLYSIDACKRSIPNMLDGLKPGQRKILFSCLDRNLETDIKVSQLAGYVSEKADYHHGESSLHGSIIKLAQQFVGSSNNINLLHPQGQFGTRLEGGKDAAKERYIYTRLSGMTRYLFHKDDDALLDYIKEENHIIEPKHYVPVIPLTLVNTQQGIGTGWCTKIPSYNPNDIIENIIRYMSDEDLIPMIPYYRGFKGSIEKMGKGTFKCNGLFERKVSNRIIITELPVGVWTENYNQSLNMLMPGYIFTKKTKLVFGGDSHTYQKGEKLEKSESLIWEIIKKDTDTRVHIELKCNPKLLEIFSDEEIYDILSLTTTINTNNMHAFDEYGYITKYKSPSDIIRSFYPVRLHYYEKRKQYQLDCLEKEIEKLQERARFILAIVNGELTINNVPKSIIVRDLIRMEFKMNIENNFDHLLGLKLWMLTRENVEEIKKKLENSEKKIDTLKNRTVIDIWTDDLDQLKRAWTLYEKEWNEFEENPKSKKKLPTGKYTQKQLKSVDIDSLKKKEKLLIAGRKELEVSLQRKKKRKRKSCAKIQKKKRKLVG